MTSITIYKTSPINIRGVQLTFTPDVGGTDIVELIGIAAGTPTTLAISKQVTRIENRADRPFSGFMLTFADGTTAETVSVNAFDGTTDFDRCLEGNFIGLSCSHKIDTTIFSGCAYYYDSVTTSFNFAVL